MPKRRTTCKTSFRATRSTARRTLSARLIACCVALLLTAQTPAPPPATPTLDQILRAHLAARAALKATVDPHTVQSSGTLDGLGLHGTFAFWRDGSRERDDEILGVRTQRTLRDGEREYVQDANGGVRVIHGLLQRRQITEDFIDSGDFARHPESVVLVGAGRSADGRAIWMLRVAPPGGSTYGVGIDTSTWMVDEKSYPEGDAIATVDYADYRAIEGALIPFVEHDSNGDHAFDISSHVEHVAVNHPIDPSVFAPFAPAVVDAPAPVNVSLDTSQGHVFVRATVKGTPMTFILDSGSQGLFIDPVAAKKVGLTRRGNDGDSRGAPHAGPRRRRTRFAANRRRALSGRRDFDRRPFDDHAERQIDRRRARVSVLRRDRAAHRSREADADHRAAGIPSGARYAGAGGHGSRITGDRRAHQRRRRRGFSSIRATAANCWSFTHSSTRTAGSSTIPARRAFRRTGASAGRVRSFPRW